MQRGSAAADRLVRSGAGCDEDQKWLRAAGAAVAADCCMANAFGALNLKLFACLCFFCAVGRTLFFAWLANADPIISYMSFGDCINACTYKKSG